MWRHDKLRKHFITEGSNSRKLTVFLSGSDDFMSDLSFLGISLLGPCRHNSCAVRRIGSPGKADEHGENKKCLDWFQCKSIKDTCTLVLIMCAYRVVPLVPHKWVSNWGLSRSCCERSGPWSGADGSCRTRYRID